MDIKFWCWTESLTWILDYKLIWNCIVPKNKNVIKMNCQRVNQIESPFKRFTPWFTSKCLWLWVILKTVKCTCWCHVLSVELHRESLGSVDRVFLASWTSEEKSANRFIEGPKNIQNIPVPALLLLSRPTINRLIQQLAQARAEKRQWVHPGQDLWLGGRGKSLADIKNRRFSQAFFTALRGSQRAVGWDKEGKEH